MWRDVWQRGAPHAFGIFAGYLPFALIGIPALFQSVRNLFWSVALPIFVCLGIVRPAESRRLFSAHDDGYSALFTAFSNGFDRAERDRLPGPTDVHRLAYFRVFGFRAVVDPLIAFDGFGPV